MRLGVSVYPAELDAARDTLDRASRAGATVVFTSLHIPEDDAAGVRERAQHLAGLAAGAGLALIADVSPRVCAAFGERPWPVLRDLGIARVRLDDGYDVEKTAAISREIAVSVNASTTSAAELAVALSAARSKRPVLALHNYYPRRWTGLSTAFVADSARSWHDAGFELGGFISGDGLRRGPLRDGLPTIEDLRDADPLVQFLTLEGLGCDVGVIGDPALRSDTWDRVGDYVRAGVVALPVDLVPGVTQAMATALAEVDANRPDPAAHLVRLQHSRARLANVELPVTGGQPRARGSVTVDLASAGRYRGEIGLARTDLPPDESVAVVGRIPPASLGLVDLIAGSQPLRLLPRRGTRS